MKKKRRTKTEKKKKKDRSSKIVLENFGSQIKNSMELLNNKNYQILILIDNLR